jgi:hypothetical protein
MSERFPSLSPEQRAALAPLYGTVDAVRRNSYNPRQARTDDNRARHFERTFLPQVKIRDSLFIHQSLEEAIGIMAAYAVFLALGHTLLFMTIKSATISKYVNGAGTLVKDGRLAYEQRNPHCKFSWYTPCRKHGETKMPPEIHAIIKEVERWERMPNRREPLTTDIIHYQQLQCNESQPHALEQAMFDWLVVGIYSGNRLSEWAQEDHVRFLHQVRTAIDGDPMAFLIDDLEFYGENRRRMSLHDALRHSNRVQQVDVRWRYQKNGEKDQKKTFVRIGMGGGTLCGVTAWLRIVKRWIALKLDRKHPLAVFTESGLASSKPEFIRSSHINATLRAAAKAVYNITDKDDLAKFSSHSIRVGACVALHAAGLSQMDIKFALRWKSDTFYTYLRNLPCQAGRTHAAVVNFSPNTFSIVPTNQTA